MVDGLVDDFPLREANRLVMVQLSIIEAALQDDDRLVACGPSVFAGILDVTLGVGACDAEEDDEERPQLPDCAGIFNFPRSLRQ